MLLYLSHLDRLCTPLPGLSQNSSPPTSRSCEKMADNVKRLYFQLGVNEYRNMAQNMEQLFKADVSVRKDTSSPEQFLRALCKGTLVAKYLFFNGVVAKPQKAE